MRVKSCQGSGNNQGLLLLATLASIRIAQGLNAEQIELLSTLFEIVGNNLSLLALKVPSGETFCPCGEAQRGNGPDRQAG